jgi:hypothetical protein
LELNRRLTKNLEIALGGGKQRVPWARLKEAPDEFVLGKYLPTGVTLSQHHHIRLEDADALLKHWTQRQAAGEIPFRFKDALKANRAGKRGSTDTNGTTSVGETERSGGDQRDAEENQEQGSDGESPGDSPQQVPESTRNQGNVSSLPTHGYSIYSLVIIKRIHSLLATVPAAEDLHELPMPVKSGRQKKTGEMKLPTHPTLRPLTGAHVHALSLTVQGPIKWTGCLPIMCASYVSFAHETECLSLDGCRQRPGVAAQA